MLTALIADDEKLAQLTLASLLKENAEIGDIYLARDGAKAKLLIEQHQPDIIFLDIQMPGLNGLELVQELQIANRVIFVTAYHQKTDEIKALNPIGYLLKPFDDDKFHQVLKLAIDTLKAKL